MICLVRKDFNEECTLFVLLESLLFTIVLFGYTILRPFSSFNPYNIFEPSLSYFLLPKLHPSQSYRTFQHMSFQVKTDSFSPKYSNVVKQVQWLFYAHHLRNDAILKPDEIFVIGIYFIPSKNIIFNRHWARDQLFMERKGCPATYSEN